MFDSFMLSNLLALVFLFSSSLILKVSVEITILSKKEKKKERAA